jgi:hypothetical protein
MTAVLIFIAQFAMIFLLGWQQQNIAKRLYLQAAITSMLIGIAGWFSITILATMRTFDILSIVFAAYIVAGPMAIVLSMHAHDHIFKRSKQS